MGATLWDFEAAGCRYLENDTNINIWLKKNPDDNDVMTVPIFLDR